MKSIYKTNFFDSDTFEIIKKCVFDQLNDESTVSYGEELKRYYKVVFLPKEIESMLLEKAKKETGDDSLDVVYIQIVNYKIKDGAVPALRDHKDVTTGEWVMDIVIDGTIDWPLVINGTSFSNAPNSVFFIRGEEDTHGRPDFPSENENDYLILLFVHLANKDSDYMRMSKKIFSMEESALKAFLKAASPAWRKES